MLHFGILELFIILAIVVLLFGVDYISTLMKEAGKGIHCF
jgi:TatA/E family protein of Tat protein translocase